jgi:hypothetical protein
LIIESINVVDKKKRIIKNFEYHVFNTNYHHESLVDAVCFNLLECDIDMHHDQNQEKLN